MSITAEDITSALRKHGAISPGALAQHLGVDQLPGQLIKTMLEENTIKAAGAARGRRLALPDQEIKGVTDAPPQPRKQRKAKKARKPKKARTAQAPRTAAPAERFVPTVDSEKRLHIINGAAPLSFNDEQTAAIATLLLQHYGA